MVWQHAPLYGPSKRWLFGAEFDVIANGQILVRLTKDNRLSFVHLGIPCRLLTWARSHPVLSWDSIWSKSGLVGLAFERVQAGNQLLLFTMQLCVVLYEPSCYFSVENPELCWTRPFAVVSFVHNLPGVAVVKVYYDQFGTRYSKPTLFLHHLPCLHSLADPPRQRVGEQHFLRGRCWYNGEFRFMTSLASPYPPKLASLFASLVRNSLVLRKRAVDCGVETPMAVCKYDAGRPFPAVGPFFPPRPWLNFRVI